MIERESLKKSVLMYRMIMYCSLVDSLTTDQYTDLSKMDMKRHG